MAVASAMIQPARHAWFSALHGSPTTINKKHASKENASNGFMHSAFQHWYSRSNHVSSNSNVKRSIIGR